MNNTRNRFCRFCPSNAKGVAAGTDRAFLAAEGTNIRKTEDVVTLSYTETEWLSQQFATRTESVTPFLVSFWQSTVKLNPSTDTWTDTARLDAKIIQQEGNFAGIMAQAMQEFGVDVVYCRDGGIYIICKDMQNMQYMQYMQMPYMT